jgi:hypothetical protein
MMEIYIPISTDESSGNEGKAIEETQLFTKFMLHFEILAHSF